MARASKPTPSSGIEGRLKKAGTSWEKALWAKSDPEEKKRPPDDKVNSKLKRAVYKIVRDCIKADLVHVLKESVEFQFGDKSQVKPSPSNAENPFYWGLTAVCGTDEKLARSNKSRFSQELIYAHLHDVPPELLIGFIYQIGSSDDIGRRLKDGEFESWRGNLPAAVTAKKPTCVKDPLAPVSKASQADLEL
ncbi:MAG: hypothetical protein ABJ050_19660 [Paracoccaceae bacterium]